MPPKTKKTFSLKQEEELCEVVRNFPVIYDKSMKGYKDNIAVDNAWIEVATQVSFLENGKHFVTNSLLLLF